VQVGRRVAGRDAEGAELGEIAVVERTNNSRQRAWSPALPACSIAAANSGDAGCADDLRRALELMRAYRRSQLCWCARQKRDTHDTKSKTRNIGTIQTDSSLPSLVKRHNQADRLVRHETMEGPMSLAAQAHSYTQAMSGAGPDSLVRRSKSTVDQAQTAVIAAWQLICEWACRRRARQILRDLHYDQIKDCFEDPSVVWEEARKPFWQA
jgi:uncharacterized protein YjiS (DUF1127 family)